MAAPRPIVGVGAVVFRGERVLLVKRGAPPLKDHWSIPGGKVELGEKLRAAVERETLEETGLEVKAGPLVEIFERIRRGDAGAVAYHYVLMDYLCAVAGGELQSGDDAADADWFRLDQLNGLLLTSGTAGVIRKGFAMFRAGAAPAPLPTAGDD